MSRDALVELAERVERAAGADRVLNVEVIWTLQGMEYTAEAVEDCCKLREEPTGYGVFRRSDGFVDLTASLDAVLALAAKKLPGRWGWNATGSALNAASMKIVRLEMPVDVVLGRGCAATPALALLAALLRALAADDSEGRDG